MKMQTQKLPHIPKTENGPAQYLRQKGPLAKMGKS